MGLTIVTQESGALAGTSISNATAGTATTVLTLTARRGMLTITNTCDQPIAITKNGADYAYLGVGVGLSRDYAANDGRCLNDGDVFGAYKLTASTPTVGKLLIVAE